MSKRNSSKKHGKPAGLDIFSLIRALISVCLLVLAYSIGAAPFVSILILILAALISGFDIILAAVENALKRKDYFSGQTLIAISAAASFCVGCYIESIVMLAVYQISASLLAFAVKKTRVGLYDSVSESNAEGYARLRSILNSPAASYNSVKDKYMPYFELFSKAALIVGILFAIAVPFLTNMTYVMSIRRGCMLIAASVPVSALAALPLYSLAGLSHSAEYDVFVKNAKTLEKLGDLSTVIYDKNGVFTDGDPKLVSINSPVLDNEAFLRLAAYTAYNSSQRFVSSIVRAYSGDIIAEYITSFNDVCGCGMEAVIHGKHLLLGTQELFSARGINLPESEKKSGYILYLTIEHSYIGSLTLKENVNPYAESVISDLAALGGIKSVMMTDDGAEVSEKLSSALKIDELYYECSSDEKSGIVRENKSQMSDGSMLMYVSAKDQEPHSPADIDAKVGRSLGNADILMSSIGLFGLPVAYVSACRMRRLSIENLIFTSVVKLILIVLALTGSVTLWFIVLVNFASSIIGVLSTWRMTSENRKEENI